MFNLNSLRIFFVVMIKFIKFILYFLLTIIIIYFAGWYAFTKIYGWDELSTYSLSRVVNTAIGIPGAKYRKNIVTTSSSNIFNFDPQNYYKYEISDLNYDDEIKPNARFKELAFMDDEDRKRYFSTHSTQSFGFAREELCTNPLFCRSITIFMHPYILKEDLLPKIINILEKPCQYIIPPEADAPNTSENIDIKNLLNDLECNKGFSIFPKMKYVVLLIGDRGEAHFINIVIKRKDI